jgi:hypothetical protein
MYEFIANQTFGINGLINLSNVVFLVAFSVRDVLMLRILAIVGEGLTLPYYYFQGEKLWPPIVWGVAFMLVNAVRLLSRGSEAALHSRMIKSGHAVRKGTAILKVWAAIERVLGSRRFRRLQSEGFKA